LKFTDGFQIPSGMAPAQANARCAGMKIAMLRLLAFRNADRLLTGLSGREAECAEI
jgi:hypothetical protein